MKLKGVEMHSSYQHMHGILQQTIRKRKDCGDKIVGGTIDDNKIFGSFQHAFVYGLITTTAYPRPLKEDNRNRTIHHYNDKTEKNMKALYQGKVKTIPTSKNFQSIN